MSKSLSFYSTVFFPFNAGPQINSIRILSNRSYYKYCKVAKLEEKSFNKFIYQYVSIKKGKKKKQYLQNIPVHNSFTSVGF